MLVLSCCNFQSSMTMVSGLNCCLAVCFTLYMWVCFCMWVCVCARVCRTYSWPALHWTPVPVQHECGITVSILRLVLCKRTTALTHTTGPSVDVEPGSEIIRGRAKVDDLAVPDRLVCVCACVRSMVADTFSSNFSGCLVWIFVSRSAQCYETKKYSHCFTLVIYYCNMIINVIIIHSEVLHCCYYC